jgi:predicted aspartyl protease
MGLVHAEIELVNAVDVGMAKRHKIGEEEIRRFTVTAMVDTDALMLAINEDLRDALGLDAVQGERISRLADGTLVRLPVVGPVEVHYQDRICITSALVLPGDEEPLIGAIVLEELDVVVHPRRQELVPAHPDGPVMRLSGFTFVEV